MAACVLGSRMGEKGTDRIQPQRGNMSEPLRYVFHLTHKQISAESIFEVSSGQRRIFSLTDPDW